MFVIKFLTYRCDNVKGKSKLILGSLHQNDQQTHSGVLSELLQIYSFCKLFFKKILTEKTPILLF